MKRQEEEEKKDNRGNAGNGKENTAISKTWRLIIANVIFFAVVAGGLMMVSGRSLADILGVSYWAAKSRDDGGL